MQPTTNHSKGDATRLSMAFTKQAKPDHANRIQPQRYSHGQTMLDNVRDIFRDVKLNKQS